MNEQIQITDGTLLVTSQIGQIYVTHTERETSLFINTIDYIINN